MDTCIQHPEAETLPREAGTAPKPSFPHDPAARLRLWA
jgi:hypothetical protein